MPDSLLLLISRLRAGLGSFAGRSALVLLLGAYGSLAAASWTGVALDLGTYDSDWEFETGTREAQVDAISFQIEEKTNGELRVGARLGYFDMRVVADSAAASQKFDGEYLGLYLRLPLPITENIAFHSLLDLRYVAGRESGSREDKADIDWTETGLQLGISYSYRNLRIMPYASYLDVDGDISDDAGTGVFEMDEPQSTGLRFDYFVESGAFIRIELVRGGQTGGFLTFARRYE